MTEEIRGGFIKQFGKEPEVLVRSPARINLIGEHTDYNNGFVLPASINRSIILAFSQREDNEIHLYAFDINDSYCGNVSQIVKSEKSWVNYVIGVIPQLKKRNIETGGFNCVFGGDIPVGAGLSSSAALECGVIFGLSRLFKIELSKLDIALMGQETENHFVGLQCGIMDQFANVFGKANHVIKLDCRNYDYEYVPFMAKEYDIVLVNSGVKHSLAGTEYNVRRKECEEGVAILKASYPHVSSLRDASDTELKSVKNKMSADVYMRCKYVLEEINRVELGCEDLRRNDIISFGKKMFATHDGLQYQYHVSCKEIDFLVDEARRHSSVAGARMMGGGFGGCTINLVSKSGTANFISDITKAFNNAFGTEPHNYIVDITNGLGPIQ